MPMTRRMLLQGLALGAVLSPLPGRAAAPPRIRAIAFDGFPIFDPRSVAAKVQGLFPDQGEKLAALWSQKLFDYTWIDTAADRYDDFGTLAGEALRFATESLHIDLPAPTRRSLVAAYSELDVWPDVKPALDRLRAAGIRLAFLSNMTEAMLRSNMQHAGIEAYFEPPLSTDRVRRYKPSPAAYRMAVDAFALPKEAIGFAAFGGWDAVGATWFGYRTAWVNRLGLPAERRDPTPAFVGRGMDAVLQLAGL